MNLRLAAIALLLSSSIPASARPRQSSAQLAQARASFDAATKSYDAGQYDEALKSFERAHELSRNPVLFFNMAACAEKLAQARVAAAYLRAYLTEVPGAEDAEKVRERIGSLEERARQDDTRRADEDRRAEEDARRRKEDDERRARDAQLVVAAPAPATAPPAPPPPAPRESIGHRYEGGFIALGATGVLGIVAAGLGGSAIVKYHDLDHSCGAVGCGNRVDGVRGQAIAADAFIGLTGVAAVTTIVLFALEARHKGAAR